MLIDWFTVGAQVLNFLILVWLLKRFLYQPILDAIDTRELRIAKELADADAQKADASRARDDYQNKHIAFKKERDALMQQATETANTERLRLLSEARQAAATLSEQRHESMQRELMVLQREIGRRTQQEVFAIARKALNDLAGGDLETRIVDRFIDRLNHLGRDEKDGLVLALQHSREPLLVRSVFDLPPAQRATLEAVIQTLLGAETKTHYEMTPDLVSGIELSCGGQKVAWNIDEYLASLQKGLEDLLSVTSATKTVKKSAETNEKVEQGT
ncbi:F0F1 ATP synthase subunit B family protein [Chitinimonas sp. BJB300]|uniref:F0F1 ATP synthase subunit B family protein n=1 Tax=Chitinimonas sp. BJB300 TaxID=1559339 RepID=UPI000C10D31C|nr:F0F1 ATP synthase subunit B [Chitinimonas sp. BJB300]PHV10565.1 F0F1 ATP synthase subunit B [Chitinimonas sp. BJB300]TSJ87074.1 F0F1 ATP synthase subunit B [Chitinimonas sp. BJB300]